MTAPTALPRAANDLMGAQRPKMTHRKGPMSVVHLLVTENGADSLQRFHNHTQNKVFQKSNSQKRSAEKKRGRRLETEA